MRILNSLLEAFIVFIMVRNAGKDHTIHISSFVQANISVMQ